MLIQNIKSRNLWLWGETVMPSSETSEANKLKSEIQDLEKEKSELMNKKSNDSSSDVFVKSKEEYQRGLSDINAKIKEKKSNLNALNRYSYAYSEYDSSINNVEYTRSYTTPFKITALQSIDVTWDNPIGESYGIKTNFLQAWHNKPVVINFTGLSYIGAFGGYTVGDLAEVAQDNKSNGVLDLIRKSNDIVSTGLGYASSAISKVQDVTNSDSADYAKGKYYTVEDDDIYQINNLMSLYGEGMFTNSSANVSSSWIHLVIENEPGSDGKEQYASFIGHIRNFNYKEHIDQPFLYDFTGQFVGEPTISNKIGKGNINAKKDSSSLKLSLVTSNSGFSLGYGF